jgi:hypothetical protein
MAGLLQDWQVSMVRGRLSRHWPIAANAIDQARVHQLREKCPPGAPVVLGAPCLETGQEVSAATRVDGRIVRLQQRA